MVVWSITRWVGAIGVRWAMGTTPYFFGPGGGDNAFGVVGGDRDICLSNMDYRDDVSIPRVPLSWD